MSLKEAFQNAAVTALNAFSSLSESVTYNSKTDTSASYDPTTGIVSDPYVSYAGVEMIFLEYEATKIDNVTILTTDQQAMIAQSELTPTPKRGDTIIRSSEKWDVVSVTKDPADALWILQVRLS